MAQRDRHTFVNTTYVALLRGINVGGKRKIAMSALANCLSSNGFNNVSTYIQSGNVVFSHPDQSDLCSRLQKIILEFAGFEVPVILRTAAEFKEVVDNNPFPDTQATKLHVGFLSEPPCSTALSEIESSKWESEACVVTGREAYLYLPDGMGRAKMPSRLKFLNSATIRNWNTVSTLASMVST